jgi:hypothetical protein
MFRHVSAYGWWFDATWPSQGLPRGTFILVYGCYVKLLESVGFDPRTSLHTTPSQRPFRPTDYQLCLVIYTNSYIFKFKLYDRWRGVGPGLSPGPRSLFCTYNICHIPYPPWNGHVKLYIFIV